MDSIKIETPYIPSAFFLQKILPCLFSILFLVSPFLVDVKITRPKLMFFEIGIVVVFFLWLFISAAAGEIKISRNALILPVLIYCLAMIMFYFFSPNRPLSYTELKRVLLYVITFFIASNLLIDGSIRNFFILCFTAGTLWASLYGILQYSGGVWKISVPQMNRVFSTFGNPIFFGVYLVLAIPIIFGYFLETKNSLLKILSVIVLLLSLVALYYTKTRASWLGFGLGVFLFIVLSVKDFRRKVIFIVFALIVAGIFLLYTKDVWLRHQAHLLIWRDTINMWLSRPIFGVGIGLFHVNFPSFASEELLKIWPQASNIVNDAHNEYVQILSETGIVGFSIFLWMMFTFFYVSYRNIKLGGSRILVGIFCGTMALLSQNMFSVDMRFIISGIYLFAFMGYSLSNEQNKFIIRIGSFKIIVSVLILLAFYFALLKIIEPYRAIKVESEKVDFFDEKILDALKTIDELERLAQKYPSQFSIFEKLGWVYAKEKNFVKAIENYNKAILLKPENPGPYNNIGNIYFLMNQHSKAIEYYLKSISVKPSQIDARINLALAYYYTGQLGNAAEQLKEVLKIDPRNEKAIILMKKMKE